MQIKKKRKKKEAAAAPFTALPESLHYIWPVHKTE